MKFIIMFSWAADGKVQREGIERFAKTGGGLPPKGVTLLGRWTRADFSGGFDLIESDDVQAMTEFALGWSDLMKLEMIPVIEDEQIGPLFAKMFAPPS